MKKLKQLNKELQTIQEQLEADMKYGLSEKLQNIIDDISNLVEARVMLNFAEDLQKIINVLDTVLGDTDPDGLDPDFTEDELIDEYPIVYCFQRLNEIKSKISA